MIMIIYKVARHVDNARNLTWAGGACFRRGCGKLCYAWQVMLNFMIKPMIVNVTIVIVSVVIIVIIIVVTTILLIRILVAGPPPLLLLRAADGLAGGHARARERPPQVQNNPFARHLLVSVRDIVNECIGDVETTAK